MHGYLSGGAESEEPSREKWKRMPGVMGIGVGYVNGRNNQKGACVVLYTLDASAAVKKAARAAWRSNGKKAESGQRLLPMWLSLCEQ